VSLTLDEQERAAYIRGDTAQAKLLAAAADAPHADEYELEDSYAEGWAAGYTCAENEGSTCD